MKNEILESLRPWDCEIFDKDPCSPFICYGGGGGGSPKINIKKPHFVSEIQKQAQAGVDTTASNWEGGKKAMAHNIEGGKKALDNAARDYGGGAMFDNLNRGLTTGVQATTDFVGGFGEEVIRFGRGLLGIPEGGGGKQGPQVSSANYSGSKKKGKQASSQEGMMGKNRERLQKRDALKVRKK